eukprot:13669927-Alexandrium_andersonii.AAC.1
MPTGARAEVTYLRTLTPNSTRSELNCRTCTTASGVRSLDCAGPGTAYKLIPEVPKGCVRRRCSRRFRI